MHILLVRHWPGTRSRGVIPAAESAASGRGSSLDASATVGAGLHPLGGVALADLLGPIRDVRPGRRWWSYGDSAVGADRHRFPSRQDPREPSRADLAGTYLCSLDRPCAERSDKTVF